VLTLLTAAVLTLLTAVLSLITVLPLLAAALPASALLGTTVLPSAGRTMLPPRLLAGALRLALRLRARIVALRWIAVRHEKSPLRVGTCAARTPHDPT
jgi:hypothetical protein